MKLTVSNFNAEKHYEELCGWWKGHKWPVVPLECLPKSGVVVEGYCAGFVYQTDSCLALMEWIISNPEPEGDRTVRAQALDTLIEALMYRAKELGATAVYSFAKKESLLRRYTAAGFQITDREMTHVLRRI